MMAFLPPLVPVGGVETSIKAKSIINRVLVCIRACVRSHACVRKSRCEGGAKPHGFVRAKCVRAGVFRARHTCAITPEMFRGF